MTRRFAGHVDVAKTRDGYVLLDGRSGTYWEINGTGRVVVETLLAGGELDAAAVAVAAEYDIELEQAQRDLTEFVDEIVSKGLLIP
ncbi:lasso peptide biosynthesis PqqD family chaperone [Nocardia arthritidis]|uniref:lasso peptide biosynthesis PqqD family chaperone n=1 Tax=Nocardia arthritidis TaxID=228602 RepID=UPI00142E13FE|nr:lasso peptide biosynthesis PqqD family chaperone [Nocardia arthritidis]